jgi:putative transposase
MYRTDLLTHDMNQIKKDQLLDLLKVYQKTAVKIADAYWKLFNLNSRENNRPDFDKYSKEIRGINSVLSSGYKQMCQAQVVGQLDSYVANRQNDFKYIVSKSDLSDDIKKQLYYINKIKGWCFNNKVKNEVKNKVIYANVEISETIMRLAHSIWKHILKINRKPNLRHTNMMIDNRCVTIENSKNANSVKTIWLRLSTLNKGNRIFVPLNTYDYFLSRKGKRANSIQLNHNRKTNEITFGIMTDVKEEYKRLTEEYKVSREVSNKLNNNSLIKELGIDYGLNTLFATSDGGLFGRNWHQQLKKYDAQIQKKQKNVQKAGIRLHKSKKYRVLIQRLRGFIKTEINRYLNYLVKMKKPLDIIVERLDFSSPERSKRFNRIVQNCGRAVFKAKLQDLKDKYGINTIEVNPAYTSQQCSSCTYVDKRNRNGDKFICLYCGMKMHADVNASRNIVQRRSLLTTGGLYTSVKATLVNLKQVFLRNRGKYARCTTGKYEFPANPMLSNNKFLLEI